MKANRAKAIVIGTVLAGGAAVAVLSSTAPAVAFSSGGLTLEVTPLSPGTLVAKGAAVDVPVDVECNASFADLTLQLTERVGGQIATGSTDVSVACNGGHQRLLVRVPATSGKPFSKGSAVATASIFGCNRTTCGQESNSVTIQITR
ncbi:MAG TPA: hypothetical protein VJ851_05355 [Jatrophihabitans sp.]|nr:hypothetical protein [Jatrophihabitans sp.]